MNPQDHLPDANTANDFLMCEVFVPTFVQKLASYGINIESQEQLDDALELGFKLAERSTQSQQKAASQQTNMFKAASERLEGRTGQSNNEPDLGQVALELANNQDVYRAVLAMKIAEAQSQE